MNHECKPICVLNIYEIAQKNYKLLQRTAKNIHNKNHKQNHEAFKWETFEELNEMRKKWKQNKTQK